MPEENIINKTQILHIQKRYTTTCLNNILKIENTMLNLLYKFFRQKKIIVLAIFVYIFQGYFKM